MSERLGSADINPVIRRAFAELPKMFGGAEVLDEAETFAVTEKSREAIARLREIWSYIEGTDNERYISWDFGLLSKYHYYTGIIFSAFTYGTGEPVAKGGRYDKMLRRGRSGRRCRSLRRSADDGDKTRLMPRQHLRRRTHSK